MSGLRQTSYNRSSPSGRRTSSSGFQLKGVQKVSRRAAAGFLHHAGLAFGIFHRQVYEPYRAGRLVFGHSKLVWAGAETATAVTLREVTAAKQASQRAAGLRVLFFPLGALQVTLLGLEKQLRRGHTDATDIRSANSTILGIDRAASQSGLRIVDEIPAAALAASAPRATGPSRKERRPSRSRPSHKHTSRSQPQGARPSHKRTSRHPQTRRATP